MNPQTMGMGMPTPDLFAVPPMGLMGAVQQAGNPLGMAQASGPTLDQPPQSSLLQALIALAGGGGQYQSGLASPQPPAGWTAGLGAPGTGGY